jgi:hypothetical protein
LNIQIKNTNTKYDKEYYNIQEKVPKIIEEAKLFKKLSQSKVRKCAQITKEDNAPIPLLWIIPSVLVIQLYNMMDMSFIPEYWNIATK